MKKNIEKIFTILLVDDRAENLQSLAYLLERDNRRFLTATSGNEALKLVLKHKEIGLIMLDVQMPQMDGFEVAQLLKSNINTRDIAIIFVTAISTSEQNVLKGFTEGAVDYLQKPLDVNVTRAKVDVFEKLFFYQQELKQSRNEVEQINRQLDRFVSMVSHDLKSPLASIITLLSVIKNKVTVLEPEALQDNIDMVYLASTQLSEMINSILDYSKQSLSEQLTEEVDTVELLQQITFLLFPPTHVKINIDPGMPVLFTQKSKLRQVFQNLLSNALKYADKEISLIEVRAEEKENYHLFSVKDNGPGIAANDKTRIFNLFETTTNQSTNDTATGLGLNILKIIVEEQGGQIWVDSIMGEGSTFYFEWNKQPAYL